jgi:hypothetical protein
VNTLSSILCWLLVRLAELVTAPFQHAGWTLEQLLDLVEELADA